LSLIPFRAWLLIALLILFFISAIDPPHPSDFIWEHVLTALALGFLIGIECRSSPLSNLSYSLIFIFTALHILGAHYTYSEVPYDQWSRRLLGVHVSDLIGAGTYDQQHGQRNHYDRLIHFLFGVLLIHPIRELVQRWMGVAGGRAIIIAVLIVIALGSLYEVMEWLYAAVVGAEQAELYNGQQGDMFDAQKDEGLNALGALIGAMVSAIAGRRRHSGAGTPIHT
jgi:putative membrane protein